jgi:HK97 family phage prohead protease
MTAHRSAPAVGVAQQRATASPSLIVKAEAADGERRIRFIASDESVDRYGDIIRASGWQLENFRRNPVLLYGHQSSALPIGTVEPIAVEGTELVAHAKLAKPGTSAFIDTVWELIQQDVLRASSVGFLPLAAPNPIYDTDKHLTGFEFIAQELLELSVVSVPANPNALALAKQRSLSADEMRCLFDDGTAARVQAAARLRTITLARLGRHQATAPARRGE